VTLTSPNPPAPPPPPKPAVKRADTYQNFPKVRFVAPESTS
jgi:hypothetical protein